MIVQLHGENAPGGLAMKAGRDIPSAAIAVVPNRHYSTLAHSVKKIKLHAAGRRRKSAKEENAKREAEGAARRFVFGR